MVKHMVKEGSREHVIWWDDKGTHCSCKNCEVNKQNEITQEKLKETKIRTLIDKHQSQADNYHRMAEAFREHGLKEKSWEMDKKAHPHESFALELRMILK